MDKMSYGMIEAIDEFTDVKTKILCCPKCGHHISYVSELSTVLFKDDGDEDADCPELSDASGK